MPENDWRYLWDRRGEAIRAVLGPTVPPDTVIPFPWSQPMLAGACALVFPPSPRRAYIMYATLGVTHPFEVGESTPVWEFAIKTREYGAWAPQILYDLLSYWCQRSQPIRGGLHLPLGFFQNSSGELCAGLADERLGLSVLGNMRGLYLWRDSDNHRFATETGEFGLVVAVAVTGAEDLMAQQTSPPHLLLLLKKMGVGQILSPFRECVTNVPRAGDEWERIRSLTHDEAVRELDSPHGKGIK